MTNAALEIKYRRFLPHEPLNKHPTSPTIPVAKLRLYTGRNRDLRSTSKRSQSTSPILLPKIFDRMALSCPGTPIRSNGYSSPGIDRPTSLYHNRSGVPKMSTTSNLMALSPPSLPSLPTYFASSSATGHRHRHHSTGHYDRYGTQYNMPSSSYNRYNPTTNQYTNYPHQQSSYYDRHQNPFYTTSTQHHASDYPVTHHSSHHSDHGRYPLSYSAEPSYSRNAATSSSSGYRSMSDYAARDPYSGRLRSGRHGPETLRDAIKSELRHFADDRKLSRYGANDPLSTADPLFSSLPLTSTSYLGSNPYAGSVSSFRHHYPHQRYYHPSPSMYRHPHQWEGHYYHHKSESDLNALLDLHSDPPDPWMEKSPPPGAPIVQGLPQMYQNRYSSYPSIDSLSYHANYDSYPKPSSPYRYAQSSNYLGRYNKYRY
ncbi:uncharacterized protein LOC141850045 [Brevipalpus obovatus]|uniref:uncharacterized protein LOC141850045 n=1 Tax=Brevipalpus obovatus TaxID=246614 RepID=UPI003D9E929E